MTHRSHEKWTHEEESTLISRFCGGDLPVDIARDLGRSELAIRSRLAKHYLLPSISANELDELKSLRAPRPEQTPDIENNHCNNLIAPQAMLDIQQAFKRFHFVYAIVNPRGQVYVGYSQDVWHRVAQHNRNAGSKATQNAGPWFPFSITCLAAEADARAYETEIHNNFPQFRKRSENSLKEVLAQIGVPFEADKISLVL